MKRYLYLGLLAMLVLGGHAVQAQSPPYLVNCLLPSTPCIYPGQTETNAGDAPYVWAGKDNANFTALFNNFPVVDANAALAVKPTVFLVSTSNIGTLSGYPTIDSVTMTRSGFVLLTGQSNQAQNGFWVANSGAWTRPPWYPSGGTVQAIVDETTFARAGTLYSGTLWKLATPTSGTITIDTTATTWTQSPAVVTASCTPNSSGSAGTSTVTGLGSMCTLYDVTAYGALCNGSHDDTSAINAALTAARTASATAYYSEKIIFPAYQSCIITAPINFTGFNASGNNAEVDGQNATLLYNTTTSVQAIGDFLGSQNMKVHDLKIVAYEGTQVNGIQIGRLNNTASNNGGAGMIFDHVYVSGFFTGAACYNFSGEVDQWNVVNCVNQYASGGNGLVLDGLNHFNVTSTFATESAPTDTYQSFDAGSFYNSNFYSYGGSPIWVGGTERLQVLNGYGYTGTTHTNANCVTLWGTAPSSPYYAPRLSNLELHCEGTYLTNTFSVNGPGSGGTFTAAPTFRGLRYVDHDMRASGNAIAIASGSNITAVTINGLDVSIGNALGGGVMFDTPASYTVSGHGYFAATGIWNGGVRQSFIYDIAGTTSAPQVLVQSGIPFVLASSGSMGNNGALTLTTALPRTINGAYFYFPAGAISSGSNAGWYWTIMSSTTAGTVYNSTYSSGQPALGVTTAFATTGPGAYTQTTGSYLAGPSITVIGGALGLNGTIEGKLIGSTNSTANNKVFAPFYGGSKVGQSNLTSQVGAQGVPFSFTNQGVASAQTVNIGNGSAGEYSLSGAETLTTVNSAANQTLSFSMNLATATDYMILEQYTAKLWPN